MFIGKIDKKGNTLLYIIFLCTLSVLFAFRPEKIPDFKSYKWIFSIIDITKKYCPNLLKREPTTDTEYGFVGLIFWFKFLLGNYYRLFLFFIAIISLHFSVVYIKKIVLLINPENEVECITILCLLFPYYGMYYQGIAIRGGIAMSFIIATLYYYMQKKYICSIITILLGFAIQRMTVLAVLVCLTYSFFPILKKRIYYLISALLLICAIICNLTRGKILIPVYNFIEWIFSKIFIVVDYSGYLSRTDVGRTFDKKRLFILILFLGLIYFVKESEINIKRLLNIVLCSVLLIFATLSIVGSERIYDLFSCFSVAILGIKLHQQTKKNLKLSIQGFSLFYIICNFVISVRIWMFPHL